VWVKLIKWYRKAVKGVLWVPDDRTWFRKAGDQGFDYAQTDLGFLYVRGRVVRDNKEAVGWLRKAADQGDAGAQNDLGEAYRDGAGVIQDYVQAVDLFRKAADHGYGKAQYNLGRMYAEGHGVVKNEAQAATWLRKAEERGYADALELLRTPPFLAKLTARYKSAPPSASPGAVWKYRYRGATVYYVPEACCDLMSNLYDADGSLICHPDGGIAGVGDGKCSEFLAERKDGRTLWYDGRLLRPQE